MTVAGPRVSGGSAQPRCPVVTSARCSVTQAHVRSRFPSAPLPTVDRSKPDRQGATRMTDDTKAAQARDAALQGALTRIEREFGKGTVMRMGDEGAQVRCDAIPTGALSLDLALGIGGVPRGRIVEIYGPESSGKSTMIYHVLAEAQKLGGVCAFIDAEHAMDPLYAKEIGVDIDELLVSQP